MTHRFTITWDGAAYKVSIPNYNGGEVVPAVYYDAIKEEADAWKAEYTKLLDDVGPPLRSRDGLVKALELALLWTDEENDVGPWREGAEAALQAAKGR